MPAGGTEHLVRVGDVQQEHPLRRGLGPAAMGAEDGAARPEVLAVGRALLVNAVHPAQALAHCETAEAADSLTVEDCPIAQRQ